MKAIEEVRLVNIIIQGTAIVISMKIMVEDIRVINMEWRAISMEVVK